MMIGFNELPLTGVLDMAATVGATAVLLVDGTIWTVGSNRYGQLGTGDIYEGRDDLEALLVLHGVNAQLTVGVIAPSINVTHIVNSQRVVVARGDLGDVSLCLGHQHARSAEPRYPEQI